MFSKTALMQVALTVAVIAVIARVPQARSIVFGS